MTIEVTEEDREGAREIVKAVREDKDCRGRDMFEVAQILARHRIAAYEKGLRDGRDPVREHEAKMGALFGFANNLSVAFSKEKGLKGEQMPAIMNAYRGYRAQPPRVEQITPTPLPKIAARCVNKDCREMVDIGARTCIKGHDAITGEPGAIKRCEYEGCRKEFRAHGTAKYCKPMCLKSQRALRYKAKNAAKTNE